ncbi:MAG: hypothetical protein ABIA77_07010, partial [Candidatus Omnitrophota bacterium]
MTDNKVRDKIDEELSRVFFSKTITRDPKWKNEAPAKNTYPKDRFSRKILREKTLARDLRKNVPASKTMVVYLAIVCGIVLLFVYIVLTHFMTKIDKKIFFTEFKYAFDAKSNLARPSIPAADAISANGAIAGRGLLLFDFETSLDGWEIPSWALAKDDHVAKHPLTITKHRSSNGRNSLMVEAEFPQIKWTAAHVEVQQFFDFTGYDLISADVYIPSNTTNRLRGKIILTTGE